MRAQRYGYVRRWTFGWVGRFRRTERRQRASASSSTRLCTKGRRSLSDRICLSFSRAQIVLYVASRFVPLTLALPHTPRPERADKFALSGLPSCRCHHKHSVLASFLPRASPRPELPLDGGPPSVVKPIPPASIPFSSSLPLPSLALSSFESPPLTAVLLPSTHQIRRVRISRLGSGHVHLPTPGRDAPGRVGQLDELPLQGQREVEGPPNVRLSPPLSVLFLS